MISGRRIGEWFRGESHFGSVGQPALRGWLFLFVPLAILLVSCSNSGPQSDPKPAPSAPSARILQFYASASEIERGEPATLCYGVENARSVRLEPAVEKLTPALSRCFIVTPRADASYKLIVAGENQCHHRVEQNGAVEQVSNRRNKRIVGHKMRILIKGPTTVIGE